MNKSLHILVVDDDKNSIGLIFGILEEHGYQVTAASDGFKALAVCRVRAPDLILLRWQMPLMSGLDVINRLQASEKTCNIPVILLYRKGEQGPSTPASTPEGIPVITKPVESFELISCIKGIFRERELKVKIQSKEVEIKGLSLTDPLTMLPNVRYLAEFLKTEIAQCRRYLTALSLILVEVDQNKWVLQSYGQSGLNSLMRQLSAIIGRQNRESDILARLSENEFAVFLTNTNKEGAAEVAERLRVSVAESQFVSEDQTFKITVSLGISELNAGIDDEGKILISHAKAALAQAKSRGGNMTLLAE